MIRISGDRNHAGIDVGLDQSPRDAEVEIRHQNAWAVGQHIWASGGGTPAVKAARDDDGVAGGWVKIAKLDLFGHVNLKLHIDRYSGTVTTVKWSWQYQAGSAVC